MELSEVAKKLGCALRGNGEVEIRGLATLERARQGELSFLTNPKYNKAARESQASALIVGQDFPPLDVPLLVHQNPYLTFAKAIELFYQPPRPAAQIHPTAWIDDTAQIGKGVSIGPYAVIGSQVVIEESVEIRAHCVIHSRARVGAGTLLHSGVTIREDVVIGKRCIIQNNAVIGSDGFGYAKDDQGHWYKIPQVGKVIIEDDVEIGACSTIDRAALDETRVRTNTKIDNLVQIGHGSIIGNNCLLAAQVGLAGTTNVGNNVILAGQVGAAGHLTIGDGVTAIAQTGIPHSVEPGSIISGSPFVDYKLWLKASAVYAKLPDLHKLLRNLEHRVQRMEQELQDKP
ncbi:MAG: UDP-3-O-(3-hydroxymyristoyl)glucosamine N-acyltransferase [Blastocatellia bacterium]